MNNPFDYTPSAECDEAFASLIARIESLKQSDSPDDMLFCSELEAGKMLGVLIAADNSGGLHTLYAFSGQLGDGEFHHPWFVGPVFDYLLPDGHFKTKEQEITLLNAEISQFERDSFAAIKNEYLQAKKITDSKIEEAREMYRRSKQERDARRNSGNLDEAELADMVRQSQFEKAELHRLKKRLAAELEPYALRLQEAQAIQDVLKKRRKAESEKLQDWLFSNFKLLNARGESRSLKDIFADTAFKTPPSGAGECCAPKLLQAAYLKGWRPLAMAEYWYGNPKEGELRIHGEHYPACRGKCLPILTWMLQGIDIEPPLEYDRHSEITHNPKILFENNWFCVVDKPSGMLSVPGIGAAVSLQEWLQEKYGPDLKIKVAHRLDQDTSGLVVATFDELSLKIMQSMFAWRKVRKTYVADLEGDFESHGKPRQGQIKLPLSPDYLDRPRQRVDFDRGKEAVTDYEFICSKDGRSRVIFHPHTGRTHQLRVHAASDLGLGMPIVGDRLYGKNKGSGNDRLHLHAHKLEFTFPIDRHPYTFISPLPF